MMATHRVETCFCPKTVTDDLLNVVSQISTLLGGLEGYILRKKRRIYESLTTSVQNDLKPCYEGGGLGTAFPLF